MGRLGSESVQLLTLAGGEWVAIKAISAVRLTNGSETMMDTHTPSLRTVSQIKSMQGRGVGTEMHVACSMHIPAFFEEKAGLGPCRRKCPGSSNSGA